MTPEVWIATTLLVFVGIIVTIAWFAPTGYEDEAGFHCGEAGPTHDFPGRDSGR